MLENYLTVTQYSEEGDKGMTLVDYLYVDEDRLDSYIEQFSSPVVYDKIPAWKCPLGLRGLP